MAEYTEKNPKTQTKKLLEMILYLSCMNTIMSSYFLDLAG